MALDAVAVEEYTTGRLDRDDPETGRLLERALATARRHCGWHVSPVKPGDVVTVDGPWAKVLILPTLKLVELTSITENGVELAVAGLDVSARGLVTKQSGQYWTNRYGAIVATMTHGHEAAEDFDAAVLSIVDRMSLAPSGGRPTGVGPFRFEADPVLPGSALTAGEKGLLAQHRLELPL